MIPDRKPNVVYADLEEYHIDRFDRCGYWIGHDESTLYSTLEEAIRTTPEYSPDAIYQTFNGEDWVVARCHNVEDGWVIAPNADSRKVAEFSLDMDKFPRIPSLNKEYTIKKGKFPRKTLTTYARKLKSFLTNECTNGENELFGLAFWWDEVDWKAQKANFKYRLQVDFIFYIKGDHVFNRRDTSNMIKIPEDALADCWGLNDARHVRLGLCEKRTAPGGSETDEILQVRVKLLRTVSGG
ncbi:hypothetical protein [Vibrio phage Va2]|nr:hypothetical protein [Vibrio phage Va2]